jgi:hypothetical protein
MTQTALPSSDITADSWTTEPLWSKLDRGTDTTYITGPAGATTQCEVALAAVTDPVGNTLHTINVRALAVGSAAGEKLTWYLYEGASLRATSAATTISRDTITDYSYTLSAAEADSLTAYTDLRIRLAQTTIGTGETIKVYECYFTCPDVSWTPVDPMGASGFFGV